MGVCEWWKEGRKGRVREEGRKGGRRVKKGRKVRRKDEKKTTNTRFFFGIDSGIPSNVGKSADDTKMG